MSFRLRGRGVNRLRRDKRGYLVPPPSTGIEKWRGDIREGQGWPKLGRIRDLVLGFSFSQHGKDSSDSYVVECMSRYRLDKRQDKYMHEMEKDKRTCQNLIKIKLRARASSSSICPFPFTARAWCFIPSVIVVVLRGPSREHTVRGLQSRSRSILEQVKPHAKKQAKADLDGFM